MNRRFLAVPALVVGALVAQAGLASPARAATVRYAAPGGTGTSCSATAPCSLETAINSAASGNEIVISPGTYTTATSLSRNVSNLNIHGATGQPRPVINSSAGRAIDIGLSGNGTRIADLTIVHTGGGYGLNVFAKSTQIQRVSVWSLGAVACSPGISGLMRDSLCVTSAPGGIAVDDSWSGDIGVLNLRNVTAIATGPSSFGIRADANGNNSGLVVDARNVIASGTTADVRSTEIGDSSESFVQLRTSNYDSIQEQGAATSRQRAPAPTRRRADLPGHHDVPPGTRIAHHRQGGGVHRQRDRRPRWRPAPVGCGDRHRSGRVRHHPAGYEVPVHAQGQASQAQGDVRVRRQPSL